MQSQGIDMRGKYPGTAIRIPKTFSSFVQLLVNPAYKYYICSILCVFSPFPALIEFWSLNLTFCIPQGLVPWTWLRTFTYLSLIWASMALVSKIHINMASFYVQWRGHMFHCWSLCQGKTECCYLVLLRADCFPGNHAAFDLYPLYTNLEDIFLPKFSVPWLPVVVILYFK